MEKLNLLLKQISEIVLKEKILQEEKRKRGENFNIFNVLGLSTSEVRLHSAFIAELLNPNGDHGLGSKFMESFIDNVIEKKCPCPFLFESSSAKVYVEYSIGNVTDDYKVLRIRRDIESRMNHVDYSKLKFVPNPFIWSSLNESLLSSKSTFIPSCSDSSNCSKKYI